MPRRKHKKPQTLGATGKGVLGKRRNQKLTRAQQEAVVQIYFTNGNYAQTARELGISAATVKRAIESAYDDPTLMAHRGKSIDRMTGKIHAVTDSIMDSITPEELVTTRHEVRDAHGNLLRVVTEGPSLRDKALAIGILADKQRTLQEARDRAMSTGDGNHDSLSVLIPEALEDKRRLIAAKVKRLRLLDVEFREGETAETIDMALNRFGISENDIEDADIELASGPAPFDQ